jgi:GrpB-like predicted nucleotidyltransferase (UPF0157 family)
MKPLLQLFGLVLEDIWKEQKKILKIRQFKKDMAKLRSLDEETFQTKLEALKNKEVKALLFDDYLRDTNNEKEKTMDLKKYFKKE